MPSGAEQRDAVIVGSGPNGLVAANLLVDAGWECSCSRSKGTRWRGEERRTGRGGFRQRHFSSFYPLAAEVAGPARAGVERHGLSWWHAPRCSRTR